MAQIKTIGHHATTIDTNNDMIRVTYHNTVVVKFNAGIIILNTGGYYTHTTKVRMNQASNQYNLGYKVFQKDFNWFVQYKNEVIPFRGNAINLSRN